MDEKTHSSVASQTFVSLNNAIDLIAELTSGRLRDLLKPGKTGGELAQCTNLCDCHGRYCGCYGSISALNDFSSRVLPWEEYAKLREEKINELNAQIKALEGK